VLSVVSAGYMYIRNIRGDWQNNNLIKLKVNIYECTQLDNRCRLGKARKVI